MVGGFCQASTVLRPPPESDQQLSLRKFPLASRLTVVPPAETTHGEALRNRRFASSSSGRSNCRLVVRLEFRRRTRVARRSFLGTPSCWRYRRRHSYSLQGRRPLRQRATEGGIGRRPPPE